MLNIIVAIADNGVIGGENRLLWHISEDLKNFKKITSGHPVIMGRKTFESIGRALPGRENVVVSRSSFQAPNCRMAKSLEEALNKYSPEEEVFIIGGAEIYRQCLPLASRFFLTRVHREYEGDTYFPEFNACEWSKVSSQRFERGENYEFPFTIEELRRVRTEESDNYILPCSKTDVPLLRFLAIESFPPTYENILSPEQIDYMLDWMYSEESLLSQIEEGQRFYILFHKGEPAGYLSLRMETPSLVHLEKLYFLPSMMGKGLGRILFEHAMSEVRRICGAKPCRMELNVNRANAAYDFYLRMGMHIAEEGDYKIEGTDFLRNDYIMAIDL